MSLAPGFTNLGSLRTLIRQRTNKENSQSVTDAEVNSYINSSAQELYSLLVTSFGSSYFASSYAFTTDGTTAQYPLPADFFKLQGTELSLSGKPNTFLTLKSFNMAERNRNSNVFSNSIAPQYLDIRYRLNGNSIWLTPVPTSGMTVQIYYTPRSIAMVLDTDLLDGVTGWEEYLVADVCIKILCKEESDVSIYSQQKAFQLQRIKDEATNRDSRGYTVTDVYETGWEF